MKYLSNVEVFERTVRILLTDFQKEFNVFMIHNFQLKKKVLLLLSREDSVDSGTSMKLNYLDCRI